ncbi:MAG TPA: homocysteine S-methyltransferase [Pseudolysinimonas sp.]|nr:homocysteine S-methyltransferase [Pseudolysinimonas sp.]
MDATLTTFPEALRAGPVVLDGGLGTLLEERGNDVGSALWSARVLWENPDEVRAAHSEFFAAGAQVAISGSYQVSYDGLAAAGLDETQTDALLRRSVEVATQARDETAPRGFVAASVGPYAASLGDGSEFRGDDSLGVRGLRDWHRRRLQVLADAGPDVLAVETLTTLAEVDAVVRELDGIGVPAWIAFTIDGGALRSGESLREAFAIASAVPEVVAVGVNCCAAHEVTPALQLAREITDLPRVAYPNSGEVWDGDTRSWSGDPELPDDLFREWSQLAHGVGGCCRIGPGTISRISRTVAA